MTAPTPNAPAGEVPRDPWLELDTLVRNVEEYPHLLPQITSLIGRLQRTAASWESRHEEMRVLYERAFAERESVSAALLAARREAERMQSALRAIVEWEDFPPTVDGLSFMRGFARAALAATPEEKRNA